MDGDKTGKQKRASDNRHQALATILSGKANQMQLARMLGLHRNTIIGRISGAGIRPVDKDAGGNAVYNIAEVAAAALPAGYEIEKYFEQIGATRQVTLPRGLQQDFWKAKEIRQDYEIKRADLWPTEYIVAAISRTLSQIRMSLLLIKDKMLLRTELTPEQLEIIEHSLDDSISGLATSLAENMKEFDAKFNIRDAWSRHEERSGSANGADHSVGVPDSEGEPEDDFRL